MHSVRVMRAISMMFMLVFEATLFHKRILRLQFYLATMSMCTHLGNIIVHHERIPLLTVVELVKVGFMTQCSLIHQWGGTSEELPWAEGDVEHQYDVLDLNVQPLQPIHCHRC